MLAQRTLLTAWALALSLPATPVAGQVAPPGWITAPLVSISPRQPPGLGLQPDAPALVAAPGEVFEAVPLKYADVSEVAGLLAGAANLRPNDTFTPQEPAFGSAGLPCCLPPDPTPGHGPVAATGRTGRSSKEVSTP